MLCIDTDPGIDDALALLLAERSDADVTAITTVGGNVSVDRTTRNAAFLRDELEVDAPVHSGADLDLPRDGPALHGDDGLGGVAGDTASARVSDDIDGTRATDALRASADDDTDLVALGPTTNLAEAIRADAEVLERFRSVTVMAGAIRTYGNVTRAAEFNAWADPAALETVIGTGTVRLVPVNVCREFALTRDGSRALPSPFDRMTQDYVSFYEGRGYPGGVLYDPLAVLVAVAPDLAVTADMDIAVATGPGMTRGMTVPEGREGMAEPNTEVVTGIDHDRAIERLQDLYGVEGITARPRDNL